MKKRYNFIFLNQSIFIYLKWKIFSRKKIFSLKNIPNIYNDVIINIKSFFWNVQRLFFQGRFINQLDKQCNILRCWFCDIFCIRVHGTSKRKVHSGCSDWRTWSSVYRLSCCHRYYAWINILGTHLFHDVAYIRIG